MQYPKIIIKYNRFLDPIFSVYIQSRERWADWTAPLQEDVLKRVENYNAEWRKYEKKVFKCLSDCFNLEFVRNVIDVHVVSSNPRQFNDPLVIKSSFSSQEFINILAHELTHKLFSENVDIVDNESFKNLYPEESTLIVTHVALFSGLKHLYLNILREPERLQIDIYNAKKHPTNDYIRAWKIVERDGYLNILKKFRERVVKKQANCPQSVVNLLST